MGQRLKVALMSYAMDNRPAKGTALYTRKLIENLLNDEDLDITLIHFDKSDDPLYKKAKEIIIPKISLPYGSRFFSQLSFFIKSRKKEKYDIIHWFQPRLYPFYWLAPTKHIVVTAHAAGDKTAPAFFNFPKIVFNFIFTWFNKWIDMAIAVSNYAKEEIIKHYRFKPEKVKTVYNGGGEEFEVIDNEEILRKLRMKYSLPDLFILDVARLQAHKNVETLIKSYELMRDQFPERNESLVIVGSSVRNYRLPTDLAQRSAHKDDIHFIDYVEQEDLNAMYSAAKLFVFPSLNEGFGLPVIEAMASGTPVITSNTTALPEVSGDAAVLVSPNDTKGIANAMNNVLSDQNLYAKLVDAGLKRAKEFTWGKMTEKTKEIYFSLINE